MWSTCTSVQHKFCQFTPWADSHPVIYLSCCIAWCHEAKGVPYTDGTWTVWQCRGQLILRPCPVSMRKPHQCVAPDIDFQSVTIPMPLHPYCSQATAQLTRHGLHEDGNGSSVKFKFCHSNRFCRSCLSDSLMAYGCLAHFLRRIQFWHTEWFPCVCMYSMLSCSCTYVCYVWWLGLQLVAQEKVTLIKCKTNKGS